MDTAPSDSEIFWESAKASTSFQRPLIWAIHLNGILTLRQRPVFEQP